MYDMYYEFYKRRVPYLKLEKRQIENYSAERIIMKNTNFESEFSDYSAPLKDYKKRYQRENSTEYYDSDVKYMKVILVSNDLNRIRKSAMILADGYSGAAYDDDDDDGLEIEYCDEDGNDMSTYSDIFEIELGKDMADERVAGNPYIIKTGTIVSVATKVFNCGGILFSGLETGNLGEQCSAIASVSAQNVFVGITEEMKDLPEIRRLMLERGFDIIRLPDVDPAYYRRVADELIEFGKVGFATEELKETVIGGVIRKCGKYISEERISVALTMGRLRMKESDRCLKPEHFEDCINVSAGSAMDALNEMTGLRNLKASVSEYIAVRNEIRRNPLSGLECTHLIFEGNPGGGKTVGAKLLSDILAAEGITNGAFVSASRKDIIGEFVGHTAPKVAKLFRDAAGGVLFVDEAGFFLNKSSGGYADEAVKEFVRYMEICRDVTVIFAMYPGEAARFVSLDAGLQSRISSTIRFEDYSEKELADIFGYMLRKKGYTPAKGVCAQAGKYLMELKDREKEYFGNAREARRLTDAVIKAVAVRHDKEERHESDSKSVSSDAVLISDLKTAIRSMDSQKHSVISGSYGFSAGAPKHTLAHAV